MEVSSQVSTSSLPKMYLKCSFKSIPCPQALGYTMGRTLGSGNYAKVKAAWSPFEQKMIAIKIMKKNRVDPDDLDKFLPREIDILQRVAHPNIINLYQIVETERHCLFALEMAVNGDFLDYLNSRDHLLEEEARHFFHQTCQAMSYCHSMNIAHRDLKPENMFLNKNMDIKIGDFGFALDLRKNLCQTPCGSPSYKAPEFVLCMEDKYDAKKADSWSMGAILYVEVEGSVPFGDDDKVKTNSLLDYNNLIFGGNNSREYQDLICGLLNIDPDQRLSVAEVISHEWMTYPTVRPSWNGEPGGKYSIKTCLPKFLHKVKPTTISTKSSGGLGSLVTPYAHLQSDSKSRMTTPTEGQGTCILTETEEDGLNKMSNSADDETPSKEHTPDAIVSIESDEATFSKTTPEKRIPEAIVSVETDECVINVTPTKEQTPEAIVSVETDDATDNETPTEERIPEAVVSVESDECIINVTPTKEQTPEAIFSVENDEAIVNETPTEERIPEAVVSVETDECIINVTPTKEQTPEAIVSAETDAAIVNETPTEERIPEAVTPTEEHTSDAIVSMETVEAVINETVSASNDASLMEAKPEETSSNPTDTLSVTSISMDIEMTVPIPATSSPIDNASGALESTELNLCMTVDQSATDTSSSIQPTSAEPAAKSSHSNGRRHRIVARMRTTGRRLVTFMRNIKWAQCLS